MPRNTVFVWFGVAMLCVAMHLASAEEAQAQVRVIDDTPRIGIAVQPFRLNTPLGVIQGVRVTQDLRRRPLYAPNPYGDGWRRYRFRVGHDVILEVNGNPVRTREDVNRFTQTDANTLRIWDSKTGVSGVYTVYLN